MNEPAERVSVNCRIARSAVQITRPDKQGGKGGVKMWYIPARDTMINIDELIQSSPVPVKFVNTIKIGCNGTYFHNGNFEFDITHRIEIDDNLLDYKKISVLIHEISHAECDRKNCDCLKNPDHKYREIHAYMYELKWLLEHQQKRGLKWVISKLKSWAAFDSDYYAEAAEHIMKTELWQKCLDYVK